MMEYARVEALIDRPLTELWAEIARFDGIERWASGVSACALDDAGSVGVGVRVGAIRTVTMAGYHVRERLVAIDPAAHSLRYHILEPHGLPADAVHGTIVLEAAAPDVTRMTWRSDATAFRVPAETLRTRIERFYADSIEGLKRLLSP